ncbi:MAG: YjgP/YjgQ family permease [Opitutaceae bacterium]|nr:YjgP/YjgQ family permease [Opitutaceae bacterium]
MFRSVLFTCVAAVGLFAFVLTLGNVIRDLLGYLLSGQLSLAVATELILLTVASVISYALPMGILTGILLTLGRLSADSEVTAMRTAGISLARIARPVLILAVLGVATGLYVNFESMPWTKLEYERRLHDAVRANPLSFIVPKTFIRNFPGYVVYVGDKQGLVMRDFWLWELDREGRVRRLVRASSGRFDYDDATNELILTLTNGQIETRNPKNPEDFFGSPLVGSFGISEPRRFSLAELFGRSSVRQKLEWMTYRQLQAERQRLAALPVPPGAEKEQARTRMMVELTVQEKFNTALAVLSFALVGVPLGIKVSRRETSANLGVAVVLALGYYFLTVMVGWIDRHPEYRPDLLLWLPNVIFLGVGLWLFSRIDKR